MDHFQAFLWPFLQAPKLHGPGPHEVCHGLCHHPEGVLRGLKQIKKRMLSTELVTDRQEKNAIHRACYRQTRKECNPQSLLQTDKKRMLSTELVTDRQEKNAIHRACYRQARKVHTSGAQLVKQFLQTPNLHGSQHHHLQGVQWRKNDLLTL